MCTTIYATTTDYELRTTTKLPKMDVSGGMYQISIEQFKIDINVCFWCVDLYTYSHNG